MDRRPTRWTARWTTRWTVFFSLLAALTLVLSGCETTPAAPADDYIREELEKLNGDFTKMAAARQRLEVKLIGLQQEIEEVDALLENLEDQESAVHTRINRLLGQETPTMASGGATNLVARIILATIGVIVVFTLLKIRRSRLRDSRRLQNLRQVIGNKKPESGDTDTADGQKDDR